MATAVPRLPKDHELAELLAAAWNVRNRAHVVGPTKVGAAVMTESGRIFGGCNVEHRFRSHDVHAEVNAITTMVAAGVTDLRVVAVVAERENLTPCGACMDWIFEFGGPDCLIVCDSPQRPRRFYRAAELMPHYPS